MKKTILTLLSLLIAIGSISAATIDVMLLTGKTDKHHNWEIMSGKVTELLGTYAPFKTEVVEFTTTEDFAPNFEGYDVVIMNINDVKWSEATKASFERYVERGGGVVIIHEANNAFTDWEGYNRIIGLGGWGGRTKESGGYYYYKDGEMVYDTTTEGRSGHHGRRVPFTINVRDTKHPIMKGLPTSWTHTDDELYGDLRGPAEQITVLATAFSTTESNGTGKEEPILFTVRYGKGRVFHTVLGHTGKDFSKPLDNRGFQTTLLRGTEWAATGKVKQRCTEVE